MLNALKRSEEGYEEPNVGNIIYIPEAHEKVDAVDKPTVLWFLLLMWLDLEDWAEGLHCLDRIVKDIANGVWPLYYLTEALHFAALIEFGLGDQESCQLMNCLYQEYAHPLDRHRFASEILQRWIDQASPTEFFAATDKNSSVDKLREKLSLSWSSDEFSSTPWVLRKVAEALGAEYESPYAPLASLVEEQWQNKQWKPPHVTETIEEFRRNGFPHGVTVRHRRSRNDERKEEEEVERTLRRMYEDW